MRGETRVSPVLISSHKISKKPYVQSLQKKLGVNQKSIYGSDTLGWNGKGGLPAAAEEYWHSRSS